MTKAQFLLLKLIEECSEVSQRAAKQIQFGKNEIQPGQLLNNAQRLKAELVDLGVIWHLLEDLEEIPDFTYKEVLEATELKKQKLQKYLIYSNFLGQLPEITL